MSLSILQNVTRYEVDPYVHAVAVQALPWGVYHELEASRPSVDSILGGRPAGNNLRYDMDASVLLEWDGARRPWLDFVRYHTSRDFWLEVVARFGDAIRDTYPSLEKNVGKRMQDFDVGVRFADHDKDVYLDCKPGVNTPVTRTCRVRGPHLDNPHELWAGLLYMRSPDDRSEGGDLVINRLVREARFHGKAEIHDDCVAEHARVRYEANVFACFINGPSAVHAVTEREATRHPRLLANFCAEMPFPLFQMNRRARKWRGRSS